jgi:hypothetical protein
MNFASHSISLTLIAVLLLSGGCKKSGKHVDRGFYYWKTTYRMSPDIAQRLHNLGCKRLYVRCFDVDLTPDGMIAPVGIIRHLAADSFTRKVPVVFITQPVLQQLKPAEVRELAGNINKLLTSLFEGLPLPDQVQIDCDWTARTRDVYFTLLETLKKEPFFQKKLLSCTIRLHQVKYHLDSGIPPVDRGLLMCYNMGNLKQAGSQNSILDASLAKKYLGELHSYPLALDIALPIFSWSVQFRGGRMIGILRDVQPEAVAGNIAFRREGQRLYRCLRDTSWMDYSFQMGDMIRTEESNIKDVVELAKYAAEHIRNDSLRVLIFHADSISLAKHPDDELEAIYSAFH